ncbi:Acg family FMN-binding oxidoreductase [Saccharopolyspora sp. MS10]|uniref:Acg family FMN-binding oxidoreductase n=1 Tax=Saccharopolyspora sp. MS10 TaxID=3385973 RepID=UPI0039A0A2DD
MPTANEVRTALASASRAPSVHNTQPWRWRVARHSVHLYLDPDRALGALDPTGRESVISCGAALHHARIAFGAEGWRTTVHRVPNPGTPDHVAAIEFGRMDGPDPEAVELVAAAQRRRTDRRPFLPDPVPGELVEGFAAAAVAEGCAFEPITDDRHRRDLMLAIEEAGDRQRRSPDYRAELAEWAGRHVPGAEGVPAGSIPQRHDRGMPERDFSLAAEGELAVPVLDDGALLAVLSTAGDDGGSWLVAGEALSAVLLLATRAGLATCPLSQIAEVGLSREHVRDHVLASPRYPQLALRLGWPVTAELPGPPTPRRPIDECVAPLDDSWS